MILSEQIINGRRFRIIVQEWAGFEWIAANARDEAVRQMVRELIEQADNSQKGGEPLNTIGLQQELIGDLLHENQRMLTFVEKVRELRISWPGSMSFWTGVVAALDEFDSNVSTETQQKGGG